MCIVHTYMMSKLIDDLRTSDGSNAIVFRNLVVAAARELGDVDRVISEKLRVSRTTVMRWKAGTSIPHPFMRPSVLRKLAELVEQRVRAGE